MGKKIEPPIGEATLCRLADGSLALVGDGLQMQGDFARMLPRLKQNNLQNEMLVKAAKIKHPDRLLTAIDATAGLGEDAILLAAAGFQVQMYERNPIIAALLQDALERAAKMEELSAIVSRMTFTEADSITALQQLTDRPDIILLDPMFPERQKSALIKKKFQLLHSIEQPCQDGEALLQAAIQAHPRKIIIKRPLKGPYLADVRPSHSLSGKAIRYDCIVLP